MSSPGGVGIDSYSKLVEAVQDWLSRSDLVDRIPTFIRLTEAELQRDLRMREQEVEVTGNLVPDQDFLQLPEDCLWPRYLRVDTSPIRTIMIVAMGSIVGFIAMAIILPIFKMSSLVG